MSPNPKFEISVTCIIEMPGMHRQSRTDGRTDGRNRFILAFTCFIPGALSCWPAGQPASLSLPVPIPPETRHPSGRMDGRRTTTTRMTAALITISWEPFESVGRWIPDALSSLSLSPPLSNPFYVPLTDAIFEETRREALGARSRHRPAGRERARARLTSCRACHRLAYFSAS